MVKTKAKKTKEAQAAKGTSGPMKFSAGKQMLARREQPVKATKQQKGNGK